MILHEMAHQWFGDLVTMRWWEDLWLNESFAEFCGVLAAAEATRFTRRLDDVLRRPKIWGYVQDQLPSTHPVAARWHAERGRRELRRHQLRQGRGGAEAAGRLCRPGRLLRRDAGATSRSTAGATRPWLTCWRALEASSGKELATGRGLAGDGRAEYAARGVRGRRRPLHARSPCCRRRLRSTRPCGRTTSRSACTTRPDGALVRTHRVEVDIAGARTEIPELAGRRSLT